MSDRIRKILQEKFGYTTNLPPLTRMHDDVTEGKEPQPSAHPLEKFRGTIKAILGATTTEQDGILENAIDFSALHRLANKHGFAPEIIKNFSVIELEIKKPKAKRDKDAIVNAWNAVKNKIPHWFMGLITPKDGEVLPDLDKKNITNLLTVMDKINKESEKAGKEAAKETEHAGRDTQAKKNLDKARKDAGIPDKDAGSEKKLKEKPEEVEGVKPDAKAPELEEDPSKKEAPKKKKDEN